MAKKSNTPGYLASSPASASGSFGEELVPYVPAALLKPDPVVPEPTSVAAVPLPPPEWPRVDEFLDEPDEVHRWERIGDVRQEALPATPGHGDPHATLDALVVTHLAEGYVTSVDLKTRVSQKQEYASDTCVRRAGIDPATNTRYLEELVFEVVHKRSKKETKARARAFAARGVHRQIGIFVREKTVREWQKSEDDWGDPLDLGGSLRDPCLAVALPLAALLDPALAQPAIPRALEAKDDPVSLEIKDRSEKRGEKRGFAQGKAEGEKLGRAQGQAESILTFLSARGLVVPEEVRERIRATTDPETLKRWLRRAASASSLDEVLEQGSK